MKKKQKTTKKSSYFNGLAVGIVIVLAILVLLGLFNMYKSASVGKHTPIPTSTPIPTLPPATSDPNQLPYKEPTKHAPKQAATENGYAIIPELGIKFKVGDELNDLTYSYFRFDDPEYDNYGKSFAYFSTKRLTNKDKRGCSSSSGPIGSLGKNMEYPNGGSGPMAKNVKKLEDTYYHFLAPQALCTSIKSTEILQGNQIKLLEQAFQTAELIN